MPDFIEERHELKTARRVVDVRPWTDKFQEWVSDRFNLVLISIPLTIAMNMIPSLGWVAALVLLGVILAHRHARVIMPLRYPAMNEEPDPSTGKPGDGILFFGNVRSSSPYEKFKEVWGSDDAARKHMLIIGSTGSGKSETLKGIFFNSLAWTSGFFVADGKADNKLPTDTHSLARSFGRDDDCLYLNFLLGGRTPEQVRRSRRRRTNKINPFSTADADTVIQMGANMLPKVEGEGKNWQEKALNLWRALVVALCYKRDTQGVDLSVSTLIEYMALPKIEELYIEGYEEAQERGGEWSYGFVGIKAYLESGCPAYKTDKLLAKHGYGDGPMGAGGMSGGRPGPPGKQLEQDSMAFEQHAYRTTQLMPVLNLLDKTYGYIFRDKYPEIDMVDVALNNRILCMLIPSLEKSSQEAENLGKLAIASLRVMMGRNLGSEIEGHRQELLDSKATNANYPYVVALDELAYYFSDGIAVMFAQARSLGMSMIAAAQDLEKLTEGSRASEAGAMLANQVIKIFMRIDDAKKTYEMISTILGKVTVAVRRAYEMRGAGWGYKTGEVELQEVERAPLTELQGLKAGQALLNAEGRTSRIATFYVGDDLKKYRTDHFYVLRFLQVAPPTDQDVRAFAMPIDRAADPVAKGNQMMAVMRYQKSRSAQPPAFNDVISAVSAIAARMSDRLPTEQRAIMLYQAARNAIVARTGVDPAQAARTGGSSGATADVVLPTGLAGQERGATKPAFAEPRREDRRAAGGGYAVTFTPGNAGEAAPAIAPGAAASSVAAAPEEDPLAFLDLDSTFTRKPAASLMGDSGAAKSVESAAQAVVLDPIMVLMGAGRFLNMPGSLGTPVEPDADSVSPAEMLAAGLGAPLEPAAASLSTPAAQAEAMWISQAIENARALGAAGGEEPATAVGLAQPSLDKVEVLEELLGSKDPQQSARKLEAVVSAGVTPDTLPDGPIDEMSLSALFDEFKERNL